MEVYFRVGEVRRIGKDILHKKCVALSQTTGRGSEIKLIFISSDEHRYGIC
jgi:hypothetical protein